MIGIVVGCGATLMTALYQIWAGSKQKDLKASSMQLLHAYTPQVVRVVLLLLLLRGGGVKVMCGNVAGSVGMLHACTPQVRAARGGGQTLIFRWQRPCGVAWRGFTCTRRWAGGPTPRACACTP